MERIGLTASTAPALAAGAARLALSEEYGWRSAVAGRLTVWFKGYLYAQPSAVAAARHLAGRLGQGAVPDVATLRRLFAELDGHFALAVEGPGWALAAIDRVRSIPLFYAEDNGVWVIDSHARRLKERLGLDLDHVDPETALVLGMSGFALGRKTLFRGLSALQVGEFVLFRPGREPEPHRHYVYRPRPTSAESGTQRRDLAELTLAILEKTVASADGRQIVVPLSAGLDSRLIASGLAHLGYRDVRCFAYGLRGSHEVEASRRIAERLGFPWTFVEHTPASQRALFAGEDFQAYLRFADTLDAVPFVQDIAAVRWLRNSGFADRDAIFINGQSGDYISGNHIPAVLFAPDPSLDDEGRRRRVSDALIAKHYSLWGYLKTARTLDWLRDQLWADVRAAGADLGPPEEDFALYELSEWQNRQSKYVVAGQRCYDFFGFDWRLPLWDMEYLDFWSAAPLAAKRRRSLFREMLFDEDWGGVWRGWEFPRRIVPAWIRPLRFVAKLAHAPLGRERWHRFERRYFAYSMDLVANYVIAPYARVRADQREHRNAVSWIVEAWLTDKGLGLDGRPLGG